MTSPNRIDVHQHVLSPRYAGWIRDNGIRPGGNDLPDWSPAAALKFMDSQGIATGFLSVSTPGVHLGYDTQARKWAREVNEYTADLVRADPDRFGLFATLTCPTSRARSPRPSTPWTPCTATAYPSARPPTCMPDPLR